MWDVVCCIAFRGVGLLLQNGVKAIIMRGLAWVYDVGAALLAGCRGAKLGVLKYKDAEL